MVKVLTYKECTSGRHAHTRIDPWGAAKVKVEWREKKGRAGAVRGGKSNHLVEPTFLATPNESFHPAAHALDTTHNNISLGRS